jgi:hypothetical protein
MEDGCGVYMALGEGPEGHRLPLSSALLLQLPLLELPLLLPLPLLLLLLPSLALLLHLPLHTPPSSLMLAGWLPCSITIAAVAAVAAMHMPALPLAGLLICVHLPCACPLFHLWYKYL